MIEKNIFDWPWLVYWWFIANLKILGLKLKYWLINHRVLSFDNFDKLVVIACNTIIHVFPTAEWWMPMEEIWTENCQRKPMPSSLLSLHSCTRLSSKKTGIAILFTKVPFVYKLILMPYCIGMVVQMFSMILERV